MPSQARGTALENLARVDHILSFHSKELDPTVGPPPGPDRSLVLGAIALLYAVWEAYVELVAVESTAYLSTSLQPAAVPGTVRTALQAETDPWDLVGEGWRQAWRDLVKRKALGAGTNDFGLNTAGPHQVLTLYDTVGLNPFHEVSWQNMSNAAVRQRVAELVRDRGTIVHTAQPPEGVGLNTARIYRSFVERLIDRVDATLSAQALTLTGNSP